MSKKEEQRDYFIVNCVALATYVLYEQYMDVCPEKISSLKEWAYKEAMPAARALDSRRSYSEIVKQSINKLPSDDIKRTYNELIKRAVNELPSEDSTDYCKCHWERGHLEASKSVQTQMSVRPSSQTPRKSSDHQHDRSGFSQKVAA
jgi:hypothetical protein